MVNALVKTLPAHHLKYSLLAPTGRAAKVLSGYTGERAYTIHKKIYFQQRTPSGGMHFVPAQNLHTNTIFVVDEASMIGWENYGGSGGGNLLLDLFEYVFNGKNCKLILIGDGAQLPPVGSDLSPALDLDFLKREFSLTAAICELTEVMRQREDSGILDLATDLRGFVKADKKDDLPIPLPSKADVSPIDGMQLQDVLDDVFNRYGAEGSIIITRSNKRANLFNQQIRARIYFREEQLNSGDLVMAVKNNYHWLGEESHVGFIANGDVAEVERLGRHEERYGFNFVNATLRLIDYPDEPSVEALLWLDSLLVEGASMPSAASDKLYHGVQADYAHLPTKDERKKAIKEDPFYNALQIKFAYAITCHKAQGGQWPGVIVDQGYMTEEMLDQQYFRWLYTAVTRASERLYLLNFSEKVFSA